MANREQVLDKISRNLKQIGIANVRSSSDISVLGMSISYQDAEIQKPMGGIDDQVSPFLGIGIANPGKIKIDMGSSDFDSVDKLRVLRMAAGHANNIVIENSATSAADGELEGSADMLGMGM